MKRPIRFMEYPCYNAIYQWSFFGRSTIEESPKLYNLFPKYYSYDSNEDLESCKYRELIVRSKCWIRRIKETKVVQETFVAM